MIISNSRQFIFLHVPKCAGTSVAQALAEHLAWNDVQLGATPLGEAAVEGYRAQFGLSKHCTAREIRLVVGKELWGRYFTFAIVRHPFRRQLSLYTYLKRLVDGQRSRDRLRRLLRRPRNSIFQWGTTQAYLASSSFSDFIRHESMQSGAGTYSQFHYVCDEAQHAIAVDYIAKVETLSEDLEVIAERTGVPPLSIGFANKSSDALDLRRHYTRADFELIYDRYRVDFDMFGYDPEPYLSGKQARPADTRRPARRAEAAEQVSSV